MGKGRETRSDWEVSFERQEGGERLGRVNTLHRETRRR